MLDLIRLLQRHVPEAARLDDNQSIFLENELRSVDQRIYDMKFALLKGRTLIPKIADVSEVDNEYTYQMYETAGSAKIIANAADDLPSVNVSAQEYTARIKPLGTSFSYSLFDIKAAAQKGKPLSDMLARAARRAIEEEIDELIAFGSTLHSMTGFANHASVDDSTFVAGDKAASANDTWLDAGAPNATGPEMVADINNFVAQGWNALKEAEGIGDKISIVLPAAEYAYLAATPMGDNADKTALKFVLDNNPFLESITPWHKLSGAGAGGANRMIRYVKDPMVVGCLIPMEYSPQMIQIDGLTYKVPVVARCGGSVIRYTVAVGYGDGI